MYNALYVTVFSCFLKFCEIEMHKNKFILLISKYLFRLFKLALRGVPGECNRRSLPPVSTVWHMKFEFEEGQSSTTANEENENTKSKSQDLVPTSSISNVLGSLKNFASTTYASPKKNDLI